MGGDVAPAAPPRIAVQAWRSRAQQIAVCAGAAPAPRRGDPLRSPSSSTAPMSRRRPIARRHRPLRNPFPAGQQAPQRSASCAPQATPAGPGCAAGHRSTLSRRPASRSPAGRSPSGGMRRAPQRWPRPNWLSSASRLRASTVGFAATWSVQLPETANDGDRGRGSGRRAASRMPLSHSRSASQWIAAITFMVTAGTVKSLRIRFASLRSSRQPARAASNIGPSGARAPIATAQRSPGPVIRNS